MFPRLKLGKKLTSDFGRLPKTVGFGLWPLTKVQIQRVISTSRQSTHQNTNKDFFFNVEVVCILVVSRSIATDELILILEDEPCASATIFSTNLIQQGLKSSKCSNQSRLLSVVKIDENFWRLVTEFGRGVTKIDVVVNKSLAY